MLYDSFKSNKNINDILNSEQPQYRVDLNLTDEEFVNLLKKYISDVGIKKMFENANLEKDETVTIKGEKTMSNLIMVTGIEGKRYCIDRTLIIGMDYYYYKEKEKEYTFLIFKKNPCLIVQETPREIFELIEKSEAKEKAPIINFIKLTGMKDGTDVYVNVDKVGAVSEHGEDLTLINIESGGVLVKETVEEILAKIEETTK